MRRNTTTPPPPGLAAIRSFVASYRLNFSGHIDTPDPPPLFSPLPPAPPPWAGSAAPVDWWGLGCRPRRVSACAHGCAPILPPRIAPRRLRWHTGRHGSIGSNSAGRNGRLHGCPVCLGGLDLDGPAPIDPQGRNNSPGWNRWTRAWTAAPHGVKTGHMEHLLAKRCPPGHVSAPEPLAEPWPTLCPPLVPAAWCRAGPPPGGLVG